jgi:indolepyruvate ferredoxin oxidoreductase
MAVGMPNRNTLALTHMGGEGATWIGMSRYTETDHVFQNLGDGTFYHSGLMAVRAAVAAGVNITYKILANGAIAMTGGQQIEGEPQDGRELVPDIVRQLVAQGVGRIVVVNDGSHTYRKGSLPADVPVLHRDRLDEVQAELRQVPGVTAIVYDQFCAAEARRLRKRGKLPVPAERVVINERVCEGCGDCNHVSNCIAVEPVETPFGRKRHVNQSACNLDLSCVKGYCPSFVTVHGGVLTTADDVMGVGLEEAFGSLPAPPSLTGEVVDVLITGVGGTGISTTGAVLGMAAHLDGRSASVLNQTGLAQKNGPVSSHVRIRPSGHATFARRIGRSSADVVLAADLLTTVDPKLLDLFSRERTRSVVDVAVAPTARLTVDPDVDLTPQPLVEVVRARSHETVALRFKRIATELLGPTAEANVVLLGYALQRGMLGVSAEGLERAIELNGVAVELNKRAVGLGRLLAADPAAVDRLLGHQAPAPTDEPQDALAIAEQRARVLTSYQGARYAARYRRLVDAALRREAEIEGTGEFARAVATSFHKLMAYKDEYEVARLYTDGVFRDQLGAEFSSFQGLSLNLAPQRFFPTDPRTGRPRKIAIPGRAGFLALGALARMKVLRGGPLDVFGRTEHRRRERALIREYEQLITGLLRDIGPATYELAVQLAAIPEHIRGYGDIKDASIDEAMVLQAELLAKFRELAQWESGTMTPSREEQ